MTSSIEYLNKHLKLGLVLMGILAIAAILAISPIKKNKAEAISQTAANLSGLIAVDAITGDDGGSMGTSGYYSGDLGDLIVLQGLFPTSYNSNTNAQDLAALIAVSNTVGYDNNGAFGGKTGGLADLLVLNNLFLDP